MSGDSIVAQLDVGLKCSSAEMHIAVVCHRHGLAFLCQISLSTLRGLASSFCNGKLHQLCGGLGSCG